MGLGAGVIARIIPAVRERLARIEEPVALQPDEERYRLLDAVNPENTTWHFGPLEATEDIRIPLWMWLTTLDLSAGALTVETGGERRVIYEARKLDVWVDIDQCPRCGIEVWKYDFTGKETEKLEPRLYVIDRLERAHETCTQRFP